MTGPLRAVALIGNPRSGSRTRRVAEVLASALTPALRARGVELGALDVVELADEVSVRFGAGDGATPHTPSATRLDPFAPVREADLLIVASPAYKGTYTGLLKVYLDQFPAGALANTVAVAVGLAASDGHREAVGRDVSRVLGELRAQLPVPPLALLESDLAVVDGILRARASGDLAAALGRRQLVDTVSVAAR